MINISANIIEDMLQFGAVVFEFIEEHPDYGEGSEALEFLCDRYEVMSRVVDGPTD